jgi:hypothetical protein
MMPGVLSHRLYQDRDPRERREFDARMGELASSGAHLRATARSRMRGLVGWVRQTGPRVPRAHRPELAGGHR